MRIPRIISNNKKLQKMIDKDINEVDSDTWVYPHKDKSNPRDENWYIKLVSLEGLVKCTNVYKTKKEAIKNYNKIHNYDITNKHK